MLNIENAFTDYATTILLTLLPFIFGAMLFLEMDAWSFNLLVR